MHAQLLRLFVTRVTCAWAEKLALVLTDVPRFPILVLTSCYHRWQSFLKG